MSCMKEALHILHFMLRKFLLPEKTCSRMLMGQRALFFSGKMRLAPMKWNTANNKRSTFHVHQIGKLKLCSFKLSISLLLLGNGVHALSTISIVIDDLSVGRNASVDHVHICEFESLGSLCVNYAVRTVLHLQFPTSWWDIKCTHHTACPGVSTQYTVQCGLSSLPRIEKDKKGYYHILVAQEGVNIWSTACPEWIVLSHYYYQIIIPSRIITGTPMLRETLVDVASKYLGKKSKMDNCGNHWWNNIGRELYIYGIAN